MQLFDTLAMFEDPWQIVIVLILVLVLFGGSRIRDVMNSLASGVEEFKKEIGTSNGAEFAWRNGDTESRPNSKPKKLALLIQYLLFLSVFLHGNYYDMDETEAEQILEDVREALEDLENKVPNRSTATFRGRKLVVTILTEGEAFRKQLSNAALYSGVLTTKQKFYRRLGLNHRAELLERKREAYLEKMARMAERYHRLLALVQRYKEIRSREAAAELRRKQEEMGIDNPGETILIHQEGKTLEGVPILSGKFEVPSHETVRKRTLSAAKCFLYAFLYLFFLWELYLFASPQVTSRFALLIPVWTIGLMYHVTRVVGAYQHRSRYGGLVSIRELARQYGLQELSLLMDLRQSGATPKYIINGVEYFDHQDLGDAAILLRSANAPEDGAATLVRAASHSATPSDRLPRSLHEEDE